MFYTLFEHSAPMIRSGSHKRYESKNDTNTDGLKKIFKLRIIKRFSENIRLFIFGVDKLQPYSFLFHQVSNEMISNFDML